MKASTRELVCLDCEKTFAYAVLSDKNRSGTIPDRYRTCECGGRRVPVDEVGKGAPKPEKSPVEPPSPLAPVDRWVYAPGSEVVILPHRVPGRVRAVRMDSPLDVTYMVSFWAEADVKVEWFPEAELAWDHPPERVKVGFRLVGGSDGP